MPANKVEEIIRHGAILKNVWLGPYRYQFLLTKQQAGAPGKFVSAGVRLTVYAPNEK